MKRQFSLLLSAILLNSSLASASDIDVSTRVVGGDDSTEGDWPWMVLVYAGDYFCGGSLIDESTVLTAAHCLYDEDNNEVDSSDIFVFVGEYDKNSRPKTTMTATTETYIHNGYDATISVGGNDIALLSLASSFSDVTPLTMVDTTTTNEAIAAQSDVMVIGWGSTVGYESGEGDTVDADYPIILQEAVLPLKTDSQCSAIYPSYFDSSTMLCAGEEGVDSCQGDSGGPLMIYSDDNWQQIGIVSWGAGCASAEYPGVYTRLAVYNDWINNVIKYVSVDNTLSFSLILVGASKTSDLLIINNAETEVQLSFSLSGSSEFSFDDSSCVIIEASSTCSLPITYSPINTDGSEAILTIENDLSGSTSVSTTLSGTAASNSSGGASMFFLLTLPLLWLRRKIKKY